MRSDGMTAHKDRRWLWVASQTAAPWLGKSAPVAFQETGPIQAAWQANRQVKGADSVQDRMDKKGSKGGALQSGRLLQRWGLQSALRGTGHPHASL